MSIENRAPFDSRRWLRFAALSASAGCALAVLPGAAALATTSSGPANNNIRQAQRLTGDTATSTDSDTTTATLQGGETGVLGIAPSHTVWYRWTPPATCNGTTATVDTADSNFDTVLGVYQSATTPTPGALPPPVAANDDSNGTLQSEASFTVSGARNYFIQVYGFTPDLTGIATVNVACG